MHSDVGLNHAHDDQQVDKLLQFTAKAKESCVVAWHVELGLCETSFNIR